MRKFTWSVTFPALALALISSASAQPAQPSECRGAQKPSQVAQLMFGRNIDSRARVS